MSTRAKQKSKRVPSSKNPRKHRRLAVNHDRTGTGQNQSESAFRIVADNTYDWEFWVDPEGRFSYCSPSCKRITGHGASEFLSNPGLRRSLVHPDDLARFDKHQRTVELRHVAGEDEWRFVRPDGTYRWIAHVCQPVFGEHRTYLGYRGSNRDISERKKTEKALEKSAERYKLLADVTARLLSAENPQVIVEELCTSIMKRLHCDCFFNYLAGEKPDRLHLNAYSGISSAEVRKIEWLNYGEAVCGCVARDGKRLVFEDIQHTDDPRTAIVRGYGMQAYACHPLVAHDRVIGTLSFGTRNRPSFSPDELSTMKTIADQVSIAIQRMRVEEELERSRNDLEVRVEERTAELNKTFDALGGERRRFREVLDRLPAYVVLLSEDYHVRFANKYFSEHFGESGGKRCYECLFNRTSPCENCESFKVFETGAPCRWVWAGPNGRTYDISDFPFTDVDGSRMILEMGIDITDRKKAEELIRNTNMYHRSLIEASLDPLVTIDATGRITDVNEATERVTGHNRRELIGTDFSIYFTRPDDAREGYQRVFREGSVQDYALEIKHRDGHTTPVLYNASLYRNEQEEIAGIFAAARDITDRKRTEMQLQRTSRALRTLGRCNEVLVHAASETALLRDICRVIVEEGAYRLAWVGFAENDAEKTVRPVAYAGFEEGYLERAQITWADTERGRGPTGNAIRTGRPAMSRNIVKDPDFAPWREDAIKRGYASSLVLPLRQGTDVFGALNIYAVEPDAFSHEELGLLSELADDLAFGIVALRERSERERAEEAFRLASAYNRSLIEASLDPLVTIGADGKITDVNATTPLVTGRSRAELVGTDFSDYFTDPQKARAGLEQAFREGFVRDYALELRHQDGHLTSVLYNASVYRDDGGNVIGVFAAARDVTERKRSEVALAESETKFRTLAEQSLVGIAVNNEDGYIYINKRIADIFGYSIEEMMLMRPGDVVAPQDRDRVVEMIGKRLTGQIQRTSYTFLGQRKDGSTVDIEIHGSRMEIGGKPATIAVMLDISERKRAEEALRKSEERLRYTMDNMLEGCMIIDHEWRYLYVNESVARQGHQTQEHLVGKRMLDVYPGVEDSDVFKRYRMCMENRIPQQFESKFTFPDGITNWFEFSAQPIPEGIFVMTVDITQRKRAEEELMKHRNHLEELVQERTAQLEAANNELEAFAYSVSHDLRAPLRHIDGFIGLLEKEVGPGLGEKGTRYLRTISDSAKHMGTLIDDLLSFSRMSRQEMHRTSTNMTALVREVIGELAGDVQGRTIHWDIHDLPTVIADRSMVKLVFMNLIANAQKFTRPRDAAKIEIGVLEPDGGEEHVFYIRDNGVGFDMNYVHKLFGVFQRLHSVREFEGTGIGLANVRRIIDRHGGRTWAEGEVGRGASFYFSLPLSVKEQQS